MDNMQEQPAITKDNAPTRDESVSVFTEMEEPVVTTTKNNDVQYFNVRDHGYTNGILGIENEYYVDFIRHFQECELLEKQLSQVEIAKKMLTEQRNNNGRQIDELKELLAERKQSSTSHNLLQKSARETIERTNSLLKETKSELHILLDTHRSDYTLFSGIIFFVFALIFMGADIGISYSIIADTLQMTGLDGIFLSIGLGGLSIMMKPLYDRMVEKKMHHSVSKYEGKKSTFIIVGLLAMLLVLATIFSFALLRVNIFEALVTNVNESTDAFSKNSETSAIKEVGNGSFYGKWYTKLGMISTAIAFIVGGTICMSIAIPVFFRNQKQSKFNKRIRTIENKLNDAIQAVVPINLEVGKAEVEILRIEGELNVLAEKLKKMTDSEELDIRRREIQINLSKARTSLQISSYLDAKERGVASQVYLSGKEKKDILDLNSKNDNPRIINDNESKQIQPLRPFLEVRKLLREKIEQRTSMESILPNFEKDPSTN